jgi:hypothetical protein
VDFGDEDLQAFDKDLDFAGGECGPRDVHSEATQFAVAQVEGQVEFFDGLLLDFDVFEYNLTTPESDIEILGVEIFNILSEDFVEKFLDNFFEHS